MNNRTGLFRHLRKRAFPKKIPLAPLPDVAPYPHVFCGTTGAFERLERENTPLPLAITGDLPWEPSLADFETLALLPAIAHKHVDVTDIETHVALPVITEEMLTARAVAKWGTGKLEEKEAIPDWLL